MATWFWYFVVYSLFGFCLEVVFSRVTGQEKKDRKCFYLLPLCPVYGLGAVAILLLPPAVQANPLLLLIFGGLAATAVEYLMGLFDEKVLGVRFWNYSGLWGSIGGKVCLWFTLAWGVLAVGLVYWVHPWVVRLVSAIPPWLFLPGAVLVVGDGLHSIYILRLTGTTDSLKWYQGNL